MAIEGNFGWKETVIKESTSKNGVVKTITLKTRTGERTRTEVNTSPIKMIVTGLPINEPEWQIEVDKWKELFFEDREKFYASIADSDERDWKRDIEKWDALVYVAAVFSGIIKG